LGFAGPREFGREVERPIAGDVDGEGAASVDDADALSILAQCAETVGNGACECCG